MTVYRPDDPERIRAAADEADRAAAVADTSGDAISAADPGEGMQGPFADAVRARLRDRRAEALATAPRLRTLAGRLHEQAGVIAARIAAIEHATAEAMALCALWPELTGWTHGLAGLDTGWLDVVAPMRAHAAVLAARRAAAATSVVGT